MVLQKQIRRINIDMDMFHAGQRSIYTAADRFNVLACGRRWGKSVMAKNLLIEHALEGKYCAYFGPSYKLLNEVFRSLLGTLEPITQNSNQAEKRIELITGGLIECWSLQKKDASRGRKYHLAVIDEAAFVRDLDEIWQGAIRPTLTDYKGGAWFLSTPKGKNFFYTLYMRGKSGEEKWRSFQQSTYDNPNMDKAEIDDAKKELPSLAFSQEFMAEFNDNVANPFGEDQINLCVAPLSTDEPIAYGADLAKSHDWTVIIGLDRYGQVSYFERFQRDWRQTQRALAELPSHAHLCIDSTGVGDPIGEEIARNRPNTTLFKFTSHSKQQLMEGLASAIHQRKISYPDGLIKEELMNFEYEYTNTGVRYSAPAGLHDDCVCALALALKSFNENANFGKYCFV